jgi:Transposase, Mutator family
MWKRAWGCFLMFVGGVSMAKVGQVVETMTGSKPSASTVSRVFQSLESDYEQWKQRQLEERYAYAFADGTYFTVIYNGEGCKMPILAVVGIATTGEREVLAFRVGDREKDLFPRQINPTLPHWRHSCNTAHFSARLRLLVASVIEHTQMLKALFIKNVLISGAAMNNRFLFKMSMVTPLRGDRNSRSQHFLERPEMIRQPQSHRRRSLLIATHPIRTRQPQSPMRAMEVVIEELQAHERIPFGKRVRLAGESIEPIAQGPVESFDMHRASWLYTGSQRGADFHGQQSSVLIAMLDGFH